MARRTGRRNEAKKLLRTLTIGDATQLRKSESVGSLQESSFPFLTIASMMSVL